MTEIPEAVIMWSFIGTILVCSENNISECCVNVDNCDCFCRIRFPFVYFHHYALFFCVFSLFLLQFGLFSVLVFFWGSFDEAQLIQHCQINLSIYLSHLVYFRETELATLDRRLTTNWEDAFRAAS